MFKLARNSAAVPTNTPSDARRRKSLLGLARKQPVRLSKPTSLQMFGEVKNIPQGPRARKTSLAT